MASPPRTMMSYVAIMISLNRGLNTAEYRDRLICRGDIRIFGGHVEQVNGMRRVATIVNSVVRKQNSEVIGKAVDDAAANTTARGAAGNDDAVSAGIDQIACERRSEKGTGMFLGNQSVFFMWCDFSDELIDL